MKRIVIALAACSTQSDPIDPPVDASSLLEPDSATDAPPPIDLIFDPMGVHAPASVKIPMGSPPTTGWPLVLSFHGYGGGVDALTQMHLTSVFSWAITIVPLGVQDSTGRYFWNATPACCDLYGAQPDDLGYAAMLVSEAGLRFPIDTTRIYALGFSNGGFMAEAIACSDARVAAAVDLSGASPTSCGRQAVILRAHGTADTTVPFDGGVVLTGTVAYPAADDSTPNACTSAFQPTGVTKDYFEGPELETEVLDATGCGVELWKLTDQAHLPVFGASWEADVTDWLRSKHL